MLGPIDHDSTIGPEEAEADDGGEEEAAESEEHPVLAHLCCLLAVIKRPSVSEYAYPENETRVLAVPAVSSVVGEETPRVLLVLIRHKNADTAFLGRGLLHILFPDH